MQPSYTKIVLEFYQNLREQLGRVPKAYKIALLAQVVALSLIKSDGRGFSKHFEEGVGAERY